MIQLFLLFLFATYSFELPHECAPKSSEDEAVDDTAKDTEPNDALEFISPDDHDTSSREYKNISYYQASSSNWISSYDYDEDDLLLDAERLSSSSEFWSDNDRDLEVEDELMLSCVNENRQKLSPSSQHAVDNDNDEIDSLPHFSTSSSELELSRIRTDTKSDRLRTGDLHSHQQESSVSNSSKYSPSSSALSLTTYDKQSPSASPQSAVRVQNITTKQEENLKVLMDIIWKQGLKRASSIKSQVSNAKREIHKLWDNVEYHKPMIAEPDFVDRISDLSLEEFELCAEMNDKNVTESTRRLKDGQSFTCEIACLHRKIENNIYHSRPRGICRRQNYTLHETKSGKHEKYSGNLICVCEIRRPLLFKFSVQQTIQVGSKLYYVHDVGVESDKSDRKHFAGVKEYELEEVYGAIKNKFIGYFGEFARRHKPISWPSVVNHILKLHCYYDGYTKEYVSLATIVLQYFKETVDDVSHFLEPEQIRKSILTYKVGGNRIT